MRSKANGFPELQAHGLTLEIRKKLDKLFYTPFFYICIVI